LDRIAVANASPLIFLTRASLLHLLQHFARRILVPAPVYSEIRERGSDDITVRALEISPWIELVPPPPVPEQILGWGLGPGESSVLALAYANRGMEAIIDDLAGRRCASLLGIPVRGTLGIVLAAKKRGFIPQARPVIEALIRSGMYLSRSVIEEALLRVNE
jgi:predicted nucleic acid-binding protein